MIYDVAEKLDPDGAILVKVDSHGEIQWERIYGGRGIRSVWQTADGGYIFAASHIHSGLQDAWVVKVDREGDKLWERFFGGTEGDAIASMSSAKDDGYVLAGFSYSPPSGNKEAPLFGGSDGWVIKIDSNGDKQWERSFGGEDSDAFTSVTQTMDGGYVLAGSSFSIPSGNKESPSFGSQDAWVVKLDAQGDKQWEKSFGGAESDSFQSFDQLMDGGIVLGGQSSSPISGNKESRHLGGFDYWLVKIDLAGSKQWERSFGTSAFNEGVSVVRKTSDRGVAIGVNGTDLAGNHISGIIKADSGGNQQWEQFFGDYPNIPYTVEISDLLQTEEGGYILSGSFDLPNAGIPSSGCTWGSWAAKLETPVYRAGKVVTWNWTSGVLPEATENLDDKWNTNIAAFPVGSAQTMSFVPALHQHRFFRLRAEGQSNTPPALSFGEMLTWPTHLNQKLEYSPTKNGPWTLFTGDQRETLSTHYAIVPDSLRDHYFRTRKIEQAPAQPKP
jgi:hypothetical protein